MHDGIGHMVHPRWRTPQMENPPWAGEPPLDGDPPDREPPLDREPPWDGEPTPLPDGKPPRMENTPPGWRTHPPSHLTVNVRRYASYWNAFLL